MKAPLASSPSIPVSWGELLDKLTILAIKRDRIATPDARAHVDTEYRLLQRAGSEALASGELGQLVQRLERVNARLWEVEDAIRKQEAIADFGPAFIRLARSVYRLNDQRAGIKREINDRLGSEIVEEKSYSRGDVGHGRGLSVHHAAPSLAAIGPVGNDR
ncbi:DUF6165 family protein [Sphingobium sp.]|uniref:DUF6165 family protein n=1 Tax=Sphingobium sp. TaxID=1912891 RepID=UPI002CC2FB48|nr:DUF6165 family protein [Sphingobium sp.]HUD95315.1 DUF6165 family protein [Sphingobium sp.]